MQFQTNPYLIWQLLPGIVLISIGLYIQSRPVKKRESNNFSLMMFAGSLWAFANAIQLITPNPTWQRFWHAVTYVAIMTVPTSWFLLSTKLTNFFPERIDKIEKYLWYPPAVFYLFLITSGWHGLFFTATNVVSVGGYVSLEDEYGILFFLHTAYSYALLVAGIIILSISLVTNFKKYGLQAYGLIIGVLAPLAGNAYFLFGSPPEGFPDPTPIIFTVTGIAFAWAIFGGHILEVVPLAHEAIVRQLSTGVMVLDGDKNIRDINNAALEMLELPSRTYSGASLMELVQQNMDVALVVNDALVSSAQEDKNIQVAFPKTRRTFDVHISHLGDNLDNTTGWLIQFTDISEKRQAQAELATARETLESVLDSLQDSYFEADVNGVITYANQALCNRLRLSKAELIGKHFRHITIREKIREIYESFQLVYEMKKSLGPFEYAYRSKDGRVYIAETIVSPIIEDGVVVGTRGVLRDITDRLKVEQEIKEQKDLLDSLLQQSPIAMVINDMQKKITVVNPAFEKLFGYSSEEAIGKSLDNLLSPTRSEDNGNEFSTLVMKKKETRENRRRRKDGSLVDVEIFTAPFFVGGERFGYLAFYNDISERLEAEANLEKTQSSYFAVLETLQDPYFEVNRSGVYVYVNKAFCDSIGYTREEVLGKFFRFVSSRQSVRSTIKRFAAMFENGKPIPPFDFIYRRKDGQEFPGEIVVSPIIEDGEVFGARGIIRDISLRVEAEEILRQAKEAAESRAGELAAINRVSTTVSHSLDLRDILQSVCYELTNIFPIRNAGIGLLTPDKKKLEIVAFHASDPQEKSVKGLFLPVEGNTSSMEVIRNKRTIVIQDAQSDTRTSSIADLSRQRGTKSIMIVPLLARGEAIGTIGMPANDPNYVFSKNEIELAETIAGQIAAAVDNAQLHEKTEHALDVAERDLEIGRQIQSGFFPEKLPHIPGWEIAAHFNAARQVAGDFYDAFKIKNSNFSAFVIADVCDKGVGAALFMVLFRSLLRAFSETTITRTDVREKLLNIIVSTNNFIAEYHGKSNMFATLFFGVLDPETGTLYYVNGGHEPPIILDAQGNVTQRLMPTGPAVGMFTEMVFRVEQIDFNEGDMLIGFTDGTTDAKNASGKQFTEDRLLQSVSKPWTSNFSMLYQLNSRLQEHIGAQNQFDDITLISIRRNSLCDTSLFHTIERPAHLAILGELRNFAEQAAQYSNLVSDDVFAFKLAVDELCANIIQYGFEGQEPGRIALSFEKQMDVARLLIKDNGKYFSPDEAKSPDVQADWDEREIGGLGIYFVKELMDNVTYNKAGDGYNQFVLEKRIGKQSSN
ncbi:MAG TPA: PAS domain S-box protein [Anaerolineales bacterium]|nr:PAS domain S-box protein [Anaerolineales bacterium]